MSDQGEIQSPEVSQESVESRISALADRFRKMPTSDVQVEPQAEPKEEEASPAEEVQPEGEPEEAQAQTPEELEELEYEGKKFKAPKEIKDALLRQADYTRKTQEVADRRRAVEMREATLHQTLQMAEQLSPAMGRLSLVDQQIAAIQQQLSNPALRVQDPVLYSTLGADYSVLMGQRNQLIQGMQQHQNALAQRIQELNQQAFQERVKEALPKVQGAIKNWGPEVAKTVAAYAKNTGFTQEELAHISSSAPAVISLWKAAEYDRLQAARQQAQPKVANLPPVAKPGARTAQSNERVAREKELHQDWQKGGGKDADQLAKLLKLRLGSKK